MSKPDLSIIIVSWNVRDLLFQCLQSIYNTQQKIDFEVIVVDNNSNDDTVKMIEEHFTQVKLIVNSTNLGFAKACHQGVANARSKYFLFLNDDTVLKNHTLTKSLEYFKSNIDIGVLGCKIFNPDQSIQLSVRNFPRLSDLLIILTKFHNILPKLLSQYYLVKFDYQKDQEVDQVMGAFFLTSKKVWNKIGGFDLNFFAWFEEVDYCLQVKKINLKVFYYSQTEIVHHRGASFGQLKAFSQQIMFNKSLKYYVFKNFNSFAVLLITLFLPVNLFFTIIVGLLNKLNINPKKNKI